MVGEGFGWMKGEPQERGRDKKGGLTSLMTCVRSGSSLFYGPSPAPCLGENSTRTKQALEDDLNSDDVHHLWVSQY